MGRFLVFVFVLFIFCGMQFAAMNMKEPVPMQLAAFGFLALCIWIHNSSKRRKEEARRFAQWRYMINQRRFSRP